VTGQSFEDNSTLEGVLGDLIVPAIKRKELAMREKGLVGLGLCCLVAKVRLLFPPDLKSTHNTDIMIEHSIEFVPALPEPNPNSPRRLESESAASGVRPTDGI
jgi:hypothetical protein